MRIFLVSLFSVVLFSSVSGYFALYTPKSSHPIINNARHQEFLKLFEKIETQLQNKNSEEVIALCNEAILTASDKTNVAKAYFLRSKAHYQLKKVDEAKKDLLYAKEIDFETFSKKAKYSFVKSIRELQLYESEIFSGAPKNIKKELVYSLYYVVVLICFMSLIIIFKVVRIPQRKVLLHAENS